MSPKWIGPIKVIDLLSNCLDNQQDWPPDDNGVYLISTSGWKNKPTVKCYPLYVGGNTGNTPRFVTRIGDLIADMFGFFNDDGTHGHHSGGQDIYNYCSVNNINPKNLWIGWQIECRCKRCAEIQAYNELRPELNRRRPSNCMIHPNN